MNEAIADLLVEHSDCNEKEAEIVRYGWNLLIEAMQCVMIVLGIGIVFGMIWEVIAFVVPFMILRRYCGGFHMDTPKGARILFGCILLGVVLLQRYELVTLYFGYVVVLVAMILLPVLGPVEDKHKPLSTRELKAYRHKVEFTTVGISIAYCATVDWRMWWIASNIALALLVVCTMGTIGKIKNKLGF